MSDRKKELLTTLVVIGRTMRSDRVTFTLPGNEVQVVNACLDKLQDFINDLNQDLVEIREVEIPEQDIEVILGDER